MLAYFPCTDSTKLHLVCACQKLLATPYTTLLHLAQSCHDTGRCRFQNLKIGSSMPYIVTVSSCVMPQLHTWYNSNFT